MLQCSSISNHGERENLVWPFIKPLSCLMQLNLIISKLKHGVQPFSLPQAASTRSWQELCSESCCSSCRALLSPWLCVPSAETSSGCAFGLVTLPLLSVLQNIPSAVAALLSEDGTAASRKLDPATCSSSSSFQPWWLWGLKQRNAGAWE